MESFSLRAFNYSTVALVLTISPTWKQAFFLNSFNVPLKWMTGIDWDSPPEKTRVTISMAMSGTKNNNSNDNNNDNNSDNHHNHHHHHHHHHHRLDCPVLVLIIVVKMAVIVIFVIIFTFFTISATGMEQYRNILQSSTCFSKGSCTTTSHRQSHHTSQINRACFFPQFARQDPASITVYFGSGCSLDRIDWGTKAQGAGADPTY